MGLLDVFSSQEHYGPHPSASFEGYYTKFRLPSGGSIALIISCVPGANGDKAEDVHNETTTSKNAPEVVPDLPSAGSSSSSGPYITPYSKKDPPYMISFTYVNADSTEWFQRELHPRLTVGSYRSELAQGICASLGDITADTDRSRTSPTTTKADASGFTISWPDGSFSWSGPSSHLTTWSIRHADFAFTARTTSSRTPWIPSDTSSTPAGPLARLPLPIQWHVHSLDTDCSFTLSISSSMTPGSNSSLTSIFAAETGVEDGREMMVHPLDKSGSGKVHLEKNWAYSFPTSYIWVQARDHARKTGICIAGGSLFRGVQAYLIGHHAPSGIVHSFAPPTSTSIFGISLGTTTDILYTPQGESTLEITVNGWFTRLIVIAKAAPGTFFPLSAPLKTGHRAGYTVQSFAADVEVRKWTRTAPWGKWEDGGVEKYEKGSLEFGGDLYKAHAE